MIAGGYILGAGATDRSWMVHLNTREAEEGVRMGKSRVWHTIYGITGDNEGFIVGGEQGELGKFINECLKFDFLNRKFTILGDLNNARAQCGVIKCNN